MFPSTEALRRDVARRLRRGENMILYGPHGIGKTTLLRDLETRRRTAGLPCGYVAETRSLEDILRALHEAYPLHDSVALDPEAALSRHWDTAELRGGALLLDHLTDVSNSMVRFLRRLRSGVMGIITAVDEELDHENRKLQPWRLAALSVKMPGASADLLRDLLRAQVSESGGVKLDEDTERSLIRAAAGRPGWILECAQRLGEKHYWQGSQLFLSVICTDVEAVLRRDTPGLLSVGQDSPATNRIK